MAQVDPVSITLTLSPVLHPAHLSSRFPLLFSSSSRCSLLPAPICPPLLKRTLPSRRVSTMRMVKLVLLAIVLAANVGVAANQLGGLRAHRSNRQLGNGGSRGNGISRSKKGEGQDDGAMRASDGDSESGTPLSRTSSAASSSGSSAGYDGDDEASDQLRRRRLGRAGLPSGAIHQDRDGASRLSRTSSADSSRSGSSAGYDGPSDPAAGEDPSPVHQIPVYFFRHGESRVSNDMQTADHPSACALQPLLSPFANNATDQTHVLAASSSPLRAMLQ